MTAAGDRARDLANLLEMLESWLSMHRQSILDGTISCKMCGALVLEENSERHTGWHHRHREQHDEHYKATR